MQHNSPKQSETVERFKFHTRFQKSGESIANYMAQLRALSEHCYFGTMLEDMIRDRLVCGINDDNMQRCLLAEANLTYKKAVELAQRLEMAVMNVKLHKKSE